MLDATVTDVTVSESGVTPFRTGKVFETKFLTLIEKLAKLIIRG